MLFAETMDPLAGRPGSFLRMGIGSRAEAMGNTQTACMDPSTVAAYWNPAMAALMAERRTFTTGYRFLSLGRRQGYIAFSGKIPPRVGLALALLYHGDHDIPIFNSDGDLTYQGGFMSLATHVAISYKLTRRLSIGINTTIQSNQINAGLGDAAKIKSWELGNLDFGILYKPAKPLTFGIDVKQIRGASRWEVPTFGTEMNTVIDETLPLEIKSGLAWNGPIKGKPVTLTYDADVYLIPAEDEALALIKRLKQGDQAIEHHAGAECFLFPEFPVRLGYASSEGLSCGVGFVFLKGRLQGNKLDYVFSRESNGSGLTHGVSWTVIW